MVKFQDLIRCGFLLGGGSSGGGAKEEEAVTAALNLANGNQTVLPTAGKVLSSVTIEKPDTLLPKNVAKGVNIAGVTGNFIGNTEEKTVQLALASGNQAVTPSTDKVLSKVTIEKPATLLPENIAEGVDIAGIIGTLAAGGGGGKIATGYFTTNGSTSTVAHGLGVVPDFILVCNNTPVAGKRVYAFSVSKSLGSKLGWTFCSAATTWWAGSPGSVSCSYYQNSVFGDSGLEDADTPNGIQKATEDSFKYSPGGAASEHLYIAIAGLT